jgi:hypothetical protein
MAWSRQDGRWSILVATTGEGAPTLTLEWPQVVTTPWLMPGVVVGSLLLLIGMAWWALILVVARRPRVVKVEPEVPAVPLTRRQIRELEEQRGRVRERVSAAERFPKLVRPPQDEHRGRHGAATPSDAPTVVAPRAGRRGRHGAEAPDAAAPLVETPPDETAPSVPAEPPGGVPTPADPFADGADAAPAPARARGAATRRSRREAAPRRRLGKRRVEVAPEPVAPTSEEPPVEAPARPGTPAASADAWRRTWGLVSDQPAETSGTTLWTPVRDDEDDR